MFDVSSFLYIMHLQHFRISWIFSKNRFTAYTVFIRKSFSRFSRVWKASNRKTVGPRKEGEDIWFGKLQGKYSTITCDNICFPSNQYWEIRFRMLLGLPDPYPSVRGTDPALVPDPSSSGSGSGSFPFLIKVLSGLI